MRRYWREPPPRNSLQRAAWLRLVSGVMMLGVIYLLYQWAREESTWRWLAGPDGSSASGLSGRVEIAGERAVPGGPSTAESVPPSGESESSRPRAAVPHAPSLPEASGFTDEDPEQMDAAREEFQVLTDGALKLSPVEMVLYNRMVLWVEHQSFERLRRRARSDLLFTHFHDEADRYRGQLVAMDLTAWRILDAGQSGDGVPLHEVWGVSPESINRLYVAIVVGLPKDVPVGPNVRERLRFAGYFLKLQGYQPYDAKPGAPPERSPLLIGRVERAAIPAPKVDSTQEMQWGIVALGVIAAVWAIQFLYFKRRGKAFGRPAAPYEARGKAAAVDAWLEHSGFDEPEEDEEA